MVRSGPTGKVKRANLHICLSPRQGNISFNYRERVYPFFLYKLKRLIFKEADFLKTFLDNQRVVHGGDHSHRGHCLTRKS